MTTLPKTLILVPSGFRDYYILGALHQLYVADLLRDVTTIISASSMSIVVILLAIGYEPIEIAVMSVGLNFLENGDQFKERCILKYSRDKIIKKCFRIPTLGEIKEMSSLDLYFAVFDRNKNDVVYFSTKDNPDLSVLTLIENCCTSTFDSDSDFCDSFVVDPFPFPDLLTLPKDDCIMSISVGENMEKYDLVRNVISLLSFSRNYIIKKSVKSLKKEYHNLISLELISEISSVFVTDKESERMLMFKQGKEITEEFIKSKNFPEEEVEEKVEENSAENSKCEKIDIDGETYYKEPV
jgi:hypothetical protein